MYIYNLSGCGKAVNLLWEVREGIPYFRLPRSLASARIHPRLR